MHDQPSRDHKQWTAKQRRALVIRLIRGEMTVVEAARRYAVNVDEIDRWWAQALAGMEQALEPQAPDGAEPHEAELYRLKQLVGRLLMDLYLEEGEAPNTRQWFESAIMSQTYSSSQPSLGDGMPD